MPWIPIQDSTILFTTTLATGIVEESATFAGVVAGASGTALIQIAPVDSLQSPLPVRIRFEEYGEETASGTPTHTPGIFLGSTERFPNLAEFPYTEWTPEPVPFAWDGVDDLFIFNATYAGAEESTVTTRFSIEIFDNSADDTNYNCECDDENPSRTLAELRVDLLRRLGYSAMAQNPPPGMNDLLTSFLQSSQLLLYRQYKVLRTKRMFTWGLLEGVRFYDLHLNADVCQKKLDARMIEWVGISDGTNWWQPIICGIPPECYSFNQVLGWPQRYEIRQCIEVWPPPAQGPWKLRIKGDFGLEPFAADDDKCTIDDEAVFLHALARAKAHYSQPDAANYQTDAMTYIKQLTAGSHMTRRYVPGVVELPAAIPPKWLPLGDAPP
jgi:hypothetical protein